MNKLLKLALLLALAVGSIAVYSYAQEAPQTATNHILKGTYINNGNFNGSIPAAKYTAIDPQLTVSCPGASGTCTIEADMWVDFGLGPNSFNITTICLVVDGVQTSGCPFETAETPYDGSHVHSSTSQPVSGLARGTHTVQTFAYAAQGAFIEYYATNYRVYKP